MLVNDRQVMDPGEFHFPVRRAKRVRVERTDQRGGHEVLYPESMSHDRSRCDRFEVSRTSAACSILHAMTVGLVPQAGQAEIHLHSLRRPPHWAQPLRGVHELPRDQGGHGF